MANQTDPSAKAERMVGRCEMFDEIACGGMATIHLGRMLGAGSFQRTVAIKRLHPQFARDPDFVNMFLDEARIVARIRHPNVIPTIDLVEEAGDLFIIMEFIEGISFSQLMKLAKERGERVPPAVAVRIMHGALHGLHAAHEATDEKGRSLGLVHRDVSPDNILVGTDGFPRVLDFGVARARNRQSTTRDDRVKGKLAYMAPEQVMGEALDRRTDVFAASVVLWQSLTGHRLFKAEHMVELAHKVLNQDILPPTTVSPDLPKRWDAIVMRGLERPISRRWRDALAMAEALEAVGGMANNREVGLWVRRIGADRLSELSAKVKALETKAVSEPAKVKRRVHQRSQLHIDRAELEKAVREAQRSINHGVPPVDEPKLVGPPVPEDTGEISLPDPLPGRPAGRARKRTKLGLGGVAAEVLASEKGPPALPAAAAEPEVAPPAASGGVDSSGIPRPGRPKAPPPLTSPAAPPTAARSSPAEEPRSGADAAPPLGASLSERVTVRPTSTPTPSVEISTEAEAVAASSEACEAEPPAGRGRQASLPGLAHTGAVRLRRGRPGLWILAVAAGAAAGFAVLGLAFWGGGTRSPAGAADGLPSGAAPGATATVAPPAGETASSPTTSETATPTAEPTAAPTAEPTAVATQSATAARPSAKPTATRPPGGQKPPATKPSGKPSGGLYGRK